MSEPNQNFITGTPRPEPIRISTLVLLRWVAITGQTGAVIGAKFVGIEFPLLPVILLISASVGLNLWQSLQTARKSTPKQVMLQLLFDLSQISALLSFTGGLTNPFEYLILVPVTIAATALAFRQIFLLGLATIALITISAFFSVPLRYPDGSILQLSPLTAFGHWLALVVGTIFLSSYAHRVSSEFAAKSSALFATQMALAREQRLQHLGGVVAAAAHDLGSPLATIKLISSELEDELSDRPELAEDLASLRDSADRCAELLRSMGRHGKDDLWLHATPLRAIIEDAAEPHANRGPAVRIRTDDIIIRRDPAIIHALRNLIQNAVDFARNEVQVEAKRTNGDVQITIRDDGPGYPSGLLGRIGDPYLNGKKTDPNRKSYEGMGLGLFIAKTLLERSGAQIRFSNGKPGAVIQIRWSVTQLTADERVQLGQNPQQGLEFEY